MIRRLLVANRGEIARRVFATCRRLGIETVAVHSDADTGLPFVREADVAVRLPGSAPTDTYLRADLVVEAARSAGADAIHPGYGFLSENAAFARQVVDAGLTWVGPEPGSIELMGSKVEAKKRMSDAGVPLLSDLDPAAVTDQDLPVLVKASAGGGGRGMRVVRDLGDLPAAVESASAEAVSAFGDGTVFVERFVERGRHVEVQVVGDSDGVVVFGDRDCSVQRRHQKVVEEAPAPGLTEATRRALHEAARNASAAIGYRGAGTVEFLLDPADQQFWFLEMNTRLQVEHPVTELVHGVDLVEQQLRVAEGSLVQRPAGEGPEDLTPRGHAVEVRLYAEDPTAAWQPQSGTLTRFDVPEVDVELGGLRGHGVRLDSGYVTGDEVGTHYDAMLAKLVVHAPTREQALRRLADVLRRTQVHGVRTNRDLLVEVLRHPAFVAGEVSTDFLDRHDLRSLRAGAAQDTVELSAFAAAVALAERDAAGRSVQRGIPVGWRIVISAPHVTRFEHDAGPVETRWCAGQDGYVSADPHLDAVITAPDLSEGHCALALRGPDNAAMRFHVYLTGDAVDVESAWGHVALRRTPRFVDPADQVASGSLLAPMPGSVVGVAVEPGTEVAAGEAVLVLEAMKMQHTVTAPQAGVVSEINVSVGDQVAAGNVLAVVQEEES
jgi:propionyl-CoA carboxylase alpha chain